MFKNFETEILFILTFLFTFVFPWANTSHRADRQSELLLSGEFVSVLDLEGFTFGKCPPVAFMKQAITLLKRHYPYRLAGVYVVNAGATFNFLWSLLKPILPRKALAKTFVLNKKESAAFLCDHIGRDYLEVKYGGMLSEQFHPDTSTEQHVVEYLQQGYWK